MRLFQPQSLDLEEMVTPPYMTDRDEDTRFMLLRETTQHVKEGKNRLPTPEKMAIMELSTSFEKRRLGKQQQILTEMNQRCREQEVTDLSSKLSAKCDLQTHGRGPRVETTRDNPFFSTTNTFIGNKHRASEGSLDTFGFESDYVNGRQRTNIEKTYKFFPARRIMRQQTKLGTMSPLVSKVNTMNIPRSLKRSTEHYLDSYSYKSPKCNDFKQATSSDSPRRFPPQQHQSVLVHTKPDPLAPLVLPRLSMMDAGYQDRIDSYFSSSRITSVPRSKTFMETASISGRSHRSMFNLAGHKGVNKMSNVGQGGGVIRSNRSDQDLVQISNEDDILSIDSIARGFGQSVDNLIG